MEVKTFVIARHGHYSVCSKDENLSESGIQQVKAAASAVAEVCKDKKIIIVSADTTRVVETAKIYEEYLPGALVKYSKNLRSTWNSPLAVLKDEEVLAADVAIFITHMDVAQVLRDACAKMLGVVKNARSTFEEYGSYKIISK